MEHLSSEMEHQENEENESSVEWRREKVLQLSSQGFSQREIANLLKLGIGTINRDIQYLREQSKENIKKYIDQKLPNEYEKCLIGIDTILKESWRTAYKASNEREKLQALNLAKEAYSMKMDLLTNASVIDDSIRFIAANVDNRKKKLRLMILIKRI